MSKFLITWKESGITEEAESSIASADEYKTERFGTPASEVIVELVEAVKPVFKKAAAK